MERYTITRRGTAFTIVDNVTGARAETWITADVPTVIAAGEDERRRAARDRHHDPIGAARHDQRADRYVALAVWLMAEQVAEDERRAEARSAAAKRAAATRAARRGLPSLSSIQRTMRGRS